MRINWRVRFQNRLWVTGFLAQVLILLELLLIGGQAMGWTEFQLTEEVQNWFLAVVNAVLGILSMLGIIQDPTTTKLADSKRALNYKKPN